VLQVYTQAELPLDLFDGRWKQRSSAAVLAAEQALLQRRPARGAPGPRRPWPAADGDAGPLAGPLCNSCWQRGHYKSNSRCPNFGKAALEKPRAFGQAKRVRVPLFSTSSDEAEESDEEDGNDNVCHACSQPGLLSMCDTCTRSWHNDCVSLADHRRIEAAAGAGSAWSCSVCVGEPCAAGFVGNPQRGALGRGGNQNRGRFRSAMEGSRATRAKAKRASRKGEVPRYR
jgi:hypothetical protein